MSDAKEAVITATHLRETAKVICKDLPIDELHCHPAWRAADRIEQLEKERDELLAECSVEEQFGHYKEDCANERAERAEQERDALRDMLEDSRRTIALIAEVTGTPKEPHQGFQHRLVGHAKDLAEHAERLNAKLHDINDSLRGHGFEVANHHLNGDLEPLDNWFEDNDWEPEDVPASVPIFVCPTCCYVQAAGEDACRECKTPVPGTGGEARHNARQRAEALQWTLEKSLSHQDLPPMIERLTAIADGKRQPCPCMGMMCRGCPDCMGIKGWE